MTAKREVPVDYHRARAKTTNEKKEERARGHSRKKHGKNLAAGIS